MAGSLPRPVPSLIEPRYESWAAIGVRMKSEVLEGFQRGVDFGAATEGPFARDRGNHASAEAECPLSARQQLRSIQEKLRARALHANDCRWKSSKRERALQAQQLRASFEDLKRRNRALSDRRAAELVGKLHCVSYSTVLRAAGKKRINNVRAESNLGKATG